MKTKTQKPKPITKYISNIGEKAGSIGGITADIINLPLKLTATGIRGLASGINVGKKAISSGTQVIGNTISSAGRDIANTLSSPKRKRKSKTTGKK